MEHELRVEPDQEIEKHEEPLFIKVPGYRNVLQDLVGIKQILTNMKESIKVLHEVQQVKEHSIEVFVENVERLNQQLADIDGQLPEIEDMNLHIAEDIAQHEIDGASHDLNEDEVLDEAVKDLKGELEELRGELGNL